VAYGRSISDWAANSELWLTRTSDGRSFQLTDGTNREWSPSWADAHDLYFVSDRGGTPDMWRQVVRDDLPAGAPQQVTAGLEMARAAFSVDGARLAYAKGRTVRNAFRATLRADRPVTGSDAAQLTFDEAAVESLDVSRDGRLLLDSDRSGNWDVWSMPATGGELRQLTTDPAIDAGPRWSPDDKEVVFYSSRTGQREVWVMSADGGPGRQVTRGGAETFYPTWAASGTEIVRQGGGLAIVPLSGGAERRLTTDDRDSRADASPDGRWIAFGSRRDSVWRLWRVPASGGPVERLTSGAGNHPRWSRDGKQIFFVGLEDRRGNIWSLSLATRQERPVTAFTGRPGKLATTALATDGRSLYFGWEDPRGDIWVADVVSARGR
jgi:TolB protein